MSLKYFALLAVLLSVCIQSRADEESTHFLPEMPPDMPAMPNFFSHFRGSHKSNSESSNDSSNSTMSGSHKSDSGEHSKFWINMHKTSSSSKKSSSSHFQYNSLKGK